MTDESIDNLKRTVYRHIYAGWLKGRRINGVSMQAELCFLRLNLISDGHGNFHADPDLIAIEAFPLRRDVTPEQCCQWIGELTQCGLVSLYEAGGESYGHITGFIGIQPAGKNGRRHRLHPQPPVLRDGDDSEQGGPALVVNLGESKTIPDDPVNPSAQNENENENKKKKENEKEPARSESAVSGGSILISQPVSDSGSPPAGQLDRQKARARWVTLIVQQRMIGRDNGSMHPTGSPQYNADMTSIERLWDRVWPDEYEQANAALTSRFNTLMAITKDAKGKRKPMAWMTKQTKDKIEPVSSQILAGEVMA